VSSRVQRSVSRSGKALGKLFGQDSVNPIRYMSRHDSGSGSGKPLGNMPGYDSGKQLG
jgi:hypothetical protein